ncbi:hypothetical protein yberc0001_30220 [Yersinia bercovieri ATCC 43970]|uniref:Uncharacterized protein n=1 Tax=Yersinia bercovieri ATCC 43970 TaxID=349968 RepID=A0ABM9XZM7_YERBE|nr:hypothetical protein yberc0001_30220 [Yersinia bercovieri ATCC 43970]
MNHGNNVDYHTDYYQKKIAKLKNRVYRHKIIMGIVCF